MGEFVWSRVRFFLPALGVMAMLGCGGGNPSAVGQAADLVPFISATVIGGGNNRTVRSGSVVILSGKDSDGRDSPILRTVWSSQNPAVRLEERTANSVAFEAPNVAQPTQFTFTVTVFDAENQSASANVTLTVIPALDLDKFLTVDGADVGNLNRSGAIDFQKFTVRVNPDSQNDPVAPGDTFSLAIGATLNYADRNAMCATTAPGNPDQCQFWTNNATLPLTGLGYPLNVTDVEWESNNGVAAETQVVLKIPSIDVSAFNQLIIDALPAGGPRDALLDLWRADGADITLTIDIVASPIAATATVSGPGSSTLPLGPNNDVTVSALLADGSDDLPIETLETAAAYYEAIDPGDNFVTLNDWLVARGFATRAANGSVTLLPAALNGSGEFAHAVYTNNFDLGFGRDMYTRVEASTGNVYSFVTNYPNLQSAIEARNEFVTVVMEFSPPGGLANSGGTEPKFTKFFVYAVDEDTGDQIRVRNIDFDGRGLKFVPGACTTCHGGTVPNKGDALSPNGYTNGDGGALGDIDATFFPWDLESFLYSDTDAAIPASSQFEDVRTLDDIDPQRRFTRSAQEAQFRKLNMAALATFTQAAPADPARYDTLLELLDIWYPNAPPTPAPSDCNAFACLVGNFTNNAVPPGWAAQPQLYTQVFARHCRACHTQLPNENLRLASADDFLANSSVGDMVFRTGVMPLARLTMDRLWTGTDREAAPIDLLRAALPDVGGEIPGQPLPRPAFDDPNPGTVSLTTAAMREYRLTKTGRSVKVTGKDSLFHESLSWSLAATSTDPEFPACIQDPAALADSGETAVLTPSIGMDGDYCIQLTASKPDFSDIGAAPLLVRAVDDRPTTVLASDCSNEPNPVDGSTCVAVDEVTAANPNPEVALTAALSASLNPTRILAISDPDLTDGLDSTADFEVAFSAPTPPSTFVVNAGGGFVPTAATRFELDALLAGTVGYRSGFADGPDLDALAFTVFYTASGADVSVATGTAEVLILPKSDAAPMLQILVDSPPAIVPFGGSFTGSFRVDDADATDVIIPPLAVSTMPSLAASLVVNTQPSTMGAPSGAYTYTAANAVDVNPSAITCNVGGGFMGGTPTDTFGFRVTTGTPGEPASNATGTDQQSVTLTTTVTSAQIDTALAAYIAAHDPVEGCLGCHSASLFTAAGARATLRNTADPGLSTILNSGNVDSQIGTFHDGFRPSFNIGAEYPIVRTWLYECAP